MSTRQVRPPLPTDPKQTGTHLRRWQPCGKSQQRLAQRNPDTGATCKHVHAACSPTKGDWKQPLKPLTQLCHTGTTPADHAQRVQAKSQERACTEKRQAWHGRKESQVPKFTSMQTAAAATCHSCYDTTEQRYSTLRNPSPTPKQRRPVHTKGPTPHWREKPPLQPRQPPAQTSLCCSCSAVKIAAQGLLHAARCKHVGTLVPSPQLPCLQATTSARHLLSYDSNALSGRKGGPSPHQTPRTWVAAIWAEQLIG